MVAEWLHSGCRVVTEWFHSGCRVVAGWLQSGCRVVAEWIEYLGSRLISFDRPSAPLGQIEDCSRIAHASAPYVMVVEDGVEIVQSSLGLSGNGADELVEGVRNFSGKRLNIIQIGLGTFGTFAQNLARPSEAYYPLSWIMEAVSDNSLSMLAVGVEPVPEHVNALRPILKSLPNATIVRAAVGDHGANVTVHTITPETYLRCLEKIPPGKIDDFKERATYLRNMSCVGQVHPAFSHFSVSLQSDYDVKLEVEAINAQAITYGDLSRMLNFHGAEVLVIDAEGYDCHILQSMIDHCNQHGDVWPDVIQFESMGHSDCVQGADVEDDMLEKLENLGYIKVGTGNDTQLVRRAALATQPRLQQWLDSVRCSLCRTFGESALPFESLYDFGMTCEQCCAFLRMLGATWHDWKLLPAPDEAKILRIATDGTNLFGVGEDDAIYAYQECRWESLSDSQKLSFRHVAISGDSKSACGIDWAGWGWRSDIEYRPLRWERIEYRDALYHLALSWYGNTCWAVTMDGVIYCGNPQDSNWWWKVDGMLHYVYISANSAHIWGVNWKGEVYYCNRDDDNWTHEPSPELEKLALSGDGLQVWGIDKQSRLWYRYNRRGGEWVLMPGRMSEICLSYDGSILWGLDLSGLPWTCSVYPR